MKKPFRHAALAALLAATAITTITTTAQAQTPAPDPVELELWKGAVLINTPASYRAYLTRYPQGAFAEMARAGAGLPAAAAAAPTLPPPSAAVAKLDAAALKRQPQNSGAVDFAPGAVFSGPGFVTAGHWGAKRQLTIPAGQWAVAAITDHTLAGQLEVQVTTLGLVRLDSDAAGSTLFITFNRRSLPQVFGPRTAIPTWQALDSCFSKSTVSLVRVPSSDMRVQWCTAYREEAEVPSFDVMPAPFQKDWAAALKLANATLPAHQVTVESHVLDKQGQFTSYLLRQRSGLGARLLSSTSPEPYDSVPATLNSTQLAEVTQGMHFTLVAARAHQRVFDSHELAPNGPRVYGPVLEELLAKIE